MNIHSICLLIRARTNVSGLTALKNCLCNPYYKIRKQHDVWLNILTGFKLAGSFHVNRDAHTGLSKQMTFMVVSLGKGLRPWPHHKKYLSLADLLHKHSNLRLSLGNYIALLWALPCQKGRGMGCFQDKPALSLTAIVGWNTIDNLFESLYFQSISGDLNANPRC